MIRHLRLAGAVAVLLVASALIVPAVVVLIVGLWLIVVGMHVAGRRPSTNYGIAAVLTPAFWRRFADVLEARQAKPTPPETPTPGPTSYRVVAVDADGNELNPTPFVQSVEVSEEPADEQPPAFVPTHLDEALASHCANTLRTVVKADEGKAVLAGVAPTGIN